MLPDWATEQGLAALTLSTFRTVPWNGPYYARLGFAELPSGEVTAGPAELRDSETATILRMAPDPGLTRIVGVVALGGVIGSLARYGLAEAIPHGPAGFPWATFVTNVVGCFAIGVLLARLTPRSHALLRPFLGTGILGGFTTFSTFAVDTEKLLHVQMVVASAYFFGTLAAALTAATIGEMLGGRRR